MRKRSVGTMQVLLTAIALAIAAAPAADAGSASIPRHERAVLLAEARRQAATMGEQHPHGIEAVRTTLAGVARAKHEGEKWGPTEAGLAVYFVAMRGHFVCGRCSRPSGARSPASSVLTLVVPISKQAPQGLGLPPRYPRMRRAGRPVRIG